MSRRRSREQRHRESSGWLDRGTRLRGSVGPSIYSGEVPWWRCGPGGSISLAAVR